MALKASEVLVVYMPSPKWHLVADRWAQEALADHYRRAILLVDMGHNELASWAHNAYAVCAASDADVMVADRAKEIVPVPTPKLEG